MESLRCCLSTHVAKSLVLAEAFQAPAEVERQSEKFPAPCFLPADAARPSSPPGRGQKSCGRPEARGGPAVPPGGSRAPAMAGSACGLRSA